MRSHGGFALSDHGKNTEKIGRMTQRLFVDAPLAEVRLLSAAQSHQLLRVLRMGEGAQVLLLDGCGVEAEAVITGAHDGCAAVSVGPPRPCAGEPALRVTLYQGLPKSDKLAYIIQKCVELGVHAVQPVEMARSVTRIREKDRKQERMDAVAREAAEQCGRGCVPAVYPPQPFAKALAATAQDGRMHFFCSPDAVRALPCAFADGTSSCVGLWVGPEGGMAPDECAALAVVGGVAVGLGPRILRCETAGPAALAALMSAAGEWE